MAIQKSLENHNPRTEGLKSSLEIFIFVEIFTINQLQAILRFTVCAFNMDFYNLISRIFHCYQKWRSLTLTKKWKHSVNYQCICLFWCRWSTRFEEFRFWLSLNFIKIKNFWFHFGKLNKLICLYWDFEL